MIAFDRWFNGCGGRDGFSGVVGWLLKWEDSGADGGSCMQLIQPEGSPLGGWPVSKPFPRFVRRCCDVINGSFSEKMTIRCSC